MSNKKEVPDVPLDVLDPDGIQIRSFLSLDGRWEFPDPTPMAPPIGYKPEPELGDLIRQLVHRELSSLADRSELDTFDEAEDFDIEDDPVDPLTPYEQVFEPPAVKTKVPDAPSPVEAPKAADVSQSGYPFQEEDEGPVASPAPVTPSPTPTNPRSTVQSST